MKVIDDDGALLDATFTVEVAGPLVDLCFESKEAPVLRELPELGAISTTVKVKSENFVTKKENRKEFFRFVVPSEAALQFALGEITDQELVDAMSVFACESRNKGYTRSRST